MLTHRAFKTSPFVRGVFTALGSAAIEGPVISWVADHRKHHAFSDRPGDPHSPHVDHGRGLRGALRGLIHAHVGWLFLHTHRGRRTRYAPDLIADPVVSRDRPHFVTCVASACSRRSASAGCSAGRSATASPACCGAARCACSSCTTRPTRSTRSATSSAAGASRPKDESRNLLWLALFTFGEAWHNNHHAFPTSAEHGMRRWEFDPSAPASSAGWRRSAWPGTSSASRRSGRPPSRCAG